MAVVSLLGVVEDGSLRSPVVPLNTSKQLHIVHRETTTLRLKLVTPGNTPVTLAQDDVVQFVVRQKSSDTYSQLKITGTPAPLLGAGWYEFAISSDATKFKPAGWYVYDVWVTYANNGPRAQVIAISPFYLSSATPP